MLLMCSLSLSTVVLTPILSHLLLPNLISMLIADFLQRLMEKLRHNCTHRGCGGKNCIILDIPYSILCWNDIENYAVIAHHTTFAGEKKMSVVARASLLLTYFLLCYYVVV